MTNKDNSNERFGINQSNLLFSAKKGGPTHNVSLYWENTKEFKELLELLKTLAEYGDVHFGKHADGYLLSVGTLQFKTVIDFQCSIITLLNVDILQPGAAELLAKLANAFFYDQDRRFKLNTADLSSELLMWNILRTANIAIEPRDSAQAERFAQYAKDWAKERRQELPTLFKGNQSNNGGTSEKTPL